MPQIESVLLPLLPLHIFFDVHHFNSAIHILSDDTQRACVVCVAILGLFTIMVTAFIVNLIDVVEMFAREWHG